MAGNDLIPIDRLPEAVLPLDGDERIVLQQGATNAGKTVKATISNIVSAAFPFELEYHVPTNGNTINMASNGTDCILDPAGPLATLTVNVPATGYYCHITTTQALDLLTVGGQDGASVNGGSITFLGAHGGIGYVYRSANTTWYRLY